MAFGTIKADSLINSNGSTVDLTSVTTSDATTSDSGYMSAADKTKLDGIEASATADQTGAEIKAAYEAESDTNAFTDAEQTKLAGIEASATADQTGAEIKAAYEAEADTNAFTDADHTKLDGIETGATADQTGAEIKAAYEAESDTNAFTDADHTKLDGIEAGAQVNVVTSVNTATGDVVLDADDIDDASTTHKFVTAADVTALGTLSSDLAGKADLSGGVLLTSQLPDIAVTEYKGSVANETAMLAVSGEKGDWVVRSDDGKVYIITGDDPTSASDWTALSYPTAPDTNLSYTASTRILASSTGTDVTLPEVVAAGDSGLMTGSDKTKLDGVASGATNVTNNNQLTNGAGYTTHAEPGIFSGGGTPTLASGVTGAEVRSLIGAGTSSFSGSYNDLSNKPTIPTNNNQLTNGAGYVTSSGNTIIGTDSDIDTSGATVIDTLTMTDGVITAHSTRTMTLGDLGYTGATNANYITNNNQLSNGAGYQTTATADSSYIGRATNSWQTSADGRQRLYFASTSHTYIKSSSNVYIRTNNQDTERFTFDTGGNFTAANNVTAYSDINLKKNIEVIPNALEKVSAIRGVTYDRKDIEGCRQAGVIAQEVEEVLPEVVMTGEDGIKSVAYGNLVGLLVEAVKELQERVETLESERS